jgi:hypothetical protein
MRVPLIWEVNSTLAETRTWNDGVCIYPGSERSEASLLGLGDGIFTVSSQLKQVLVDDGVDPSRITVNPNGADPERLKPRPRDPELCQRFGIEPDTVVVGFFGSFFGWHDVQTIVDLVPRLASRNAGLLFLLAGAGHSDLSEALRNRLAGFERRVILPGVVPTGDAARFFSLMDIGLSLYPQLPRFHFSPIKFFEYMACGLAVVASSIGQQAEIIVDRANGLLARPGDLEDVAHKVQTLVDDASLRHRVGAAARQTIVDGFTWRHNATRIARMCQAALDRRHGRAADVGAVSADNVSS